jgi:hypothetical protein
MSSSPHLRASWALKVELRALVGEEGNLEDFGLHSRVLITSGT